MSEKLTVSCFPDQSIAEVDHNACAQNVVKEQLVVYIFFCELVGRQTAGRQRLVCLAVNMISKSITFYESNEI